MNKCPNCQRELSPGRYCACGKWASLSDNLAVNTVKMTGASSRFRGIFIFRVVETVVLMLLLPIVASVVFPSAATEEVFPFNGAALFPVFAALCAMLVINFVSLFGLRKHRRSCRDTSRNSFQAGGLRFFRVIVIARLVLWVLGGAALLAGGINRSLYFSSFIQSGAFLRIFFGASLLILTIPYYIPLLRLLNRTLSSLETGVPAPRFSACAIVFGCLRIVCTALCLAYFLSGPVNIAMILMAVLVFVPPLAVSFYQVSCLLEYRRILCIFAKGPLPASPEAAEPVRME